MLQNRSDPPAEHESATTLLLIAIFKLIKGVLLIAVGVGAFKLINKDVGATISHWVDVLRVDPDNRLIHGLLTHLLSVSPNQLKALGVGTFFYAALLLTEGTGLLLRKQWAEYFTIITTAGLLPLEIYEMAERFTAVKVIVFIVNVAIVVYLVLRVRDRRQRTSSGHPKAVATI